ncbi:MAG TPA: isopentenyl transferase family protein [Candidatus Binataceae bacterium]|nr:isopentenyl transferase family protein [Candidatus Binataceae bacterium]
MILNYRECKRIVIVGCAGTGKTALAHRLGRETGLPVISLDSIWKPWLSAEEIPDFRSLITQLHCRDAWISDGNFALISFDLRLPRADLLVWLERSKLVCAWRAIRRTFSPGEVHKFRDLPKVLKYIWGFERISRPLIEAARMAHGADIPVVHLSDDPSVADFVRAFRSGSGCKPR